MSIRAVLGAVLGMVLGAACWSWLRVTLEIEQGARCVDWLYGVLVAWGVRFLARGYRSRSIAAIAALLTVPALLWGRWLIIFLIATLRPPVASMTEPALIRSLAVRQCLERINAGETLEFREGVTLQTAVEPADFPPGVWDQASETWANWPATERQQFADDMMRPGLESFRKQLPDIIWQSFLRSFQWQDLLWGGLALASAFRMTAPSR
ncbi:MAG: hypothetical protein ACKO3P_12665 [Planctomycetaceae bacterium]